MPIYDYFCNSCKRDFEELIFNKNEEVFCPHCGGNRLRRLVSKVSFSKGGTKPTRGWGCASCNAGSCVGCSSQR